MCYSNCLLLISCLLSTIYCLVLLWLGCSICLCLISCLLSISVMYVWFVYCWLAMYYWFVLLITCVFIIDIIIIASPSSQPFCNSGRTITHQKSHKRNSIGKCHYKSIVISVKKSAGQVTILWRISLNREIMFGNTTDYPRRFLRCFLAEFAALCYEGPSVCLCLSVHVPLRGVLLRSPAS